MTSEYIRYLANLTLLIGQSFILYGDIRVGIVLKLLGGTVILVCMVSYKLWDMVIVLLAFLLLDLSKLVIMQSA